jgi:hypothetical protein
MSVDELARCLTELEALNLVEAAPKGLHLKNLDELERLADGSD